MNRYCEIKSWMWMLGLVLVVAAAGLGQPAETDESARDTGLNAGVAEAAGGPKREYRSPMEGFAVRPPAGAVRTNRTPAVLVQWTRQDPQTAETLWTLRVYRTTFRNRQANIRDYAQAVMDSLALKPGLKIDDLTYMDVAGCPAIQITGGTKEHVVTDGTGIESKVPATRLRQAWFLRGPGEFLVLDFVAVGDRPEWTNTTWAGLLSSIELFDPGVYLLEFKANSERAKAFLESLTGEAIQSVLPQTPRWFLVYKGDRPVGWLCMQGRPARRNKVAGYEVCSWAMFQLADQPVRLVRHQQFTDPKISMGLWNGRIQLGSGERSALFVESGLRQGGLIVATFADGRRQTDERKKIPEAVMGMYLPKAVGASLEYSCL